ncbi:hypothetical protein QJQ58_17105 [Paenibacillus dendritiformis]|uniref:hypothetical protein n=1 Tax=Paenibacillus dendritiformis TaxID=130049 RepID=UPI00248AFDC8|nr:hypothetical protein [Paenibacillus dendritiformis]WGU92300.1 hypothetical protein QJQ58_17105 [Paenibacillus dendritiformis]
MDKKIISTIYDFCLEEDYDSTLVETLNLLKNSSAINALEGDSITFLSSMIPLVEDNSIKAQIIETIVESPHYVSNDTKLLDEYIRLVSLGEVIVPEAVRCFGAFSVSGNTMNEIFTKLAESPNKEVALEILVLMAKRDWGDLPSHLESFANEVETLQRLSYRSGVISTFLLIVHPLCSRYAHISSFSFGYPSTEVAVNDWAWVTPESTKYMLDRKIVSPKEANILVELGRLIRSDKNNLGAADMTKLYNQFFEGKNPFDVMYTLPE